MSRSIIPIGFEYTSHKIFNNYIGPLSEIIRNNQIITSNNNNNNNNNNNIEREEEERRLSIEVCPICLSSYDNPVTLIFCCHSYCLNCLLHWLVKKQICPLCKSCSNYFIQNDNYKKDKKKVKILTIGRNTELLTTELIDNAIQIHIQRFQYDQNNNVNNNTNNNNNSTITIEQSKKRRNKDFELNESEYSSKKNKVVELSSEEKLDEEINRINQEIGETKERILDLDRIILNSKVNTNII